MPDFYQLFLLLKRRHYNLFVYNMFIRPTEKELESFEPEWTVINAPGFMADPEVDGTRQHN